MPPKPVGSNQNLRAQFEQMRNQMQQPGGADADSLRAAAERRNAERQANILRRRQQAAEDLGLVKSKPSLAARVVRCVVIFGFLAVVLGAVVLVTGSRSSIAVLRDATCTLRRHVFPRNVGRAEVEWLDRAIGDAYQAQVHSEEHNRTLFWGTYRPNVLAGVKSREEKPLLFGLAFWDGKKLFPVRHTAEDGDAVFFRWDVHDGRWYGRELIEDRQLGVRLRVRFAKSPTRDGWVVSIDSQRSFFRPLAFALYFASEFEGSALDVRSARAPTDRGVAPGGLAEGAFSVDAKLLVSGRLQRGGTRFVATVEDRAGASAQESQWQVFGLQARDRRMAWQINFWDDLRGNRRLEEHRLVGGSGNGNDRERRTAIVMMKKVSGDFRFDVTLAEQGGVEDALVFQDGCANEAVFEFLEGNFRQRFHDAFRIGEHFAALQAAWPAAFSSASGITAASFLSMCESGLSNLLGGMGYWHGDYRVMRQQHPSRVVETHGPRSLFSGVPSRAKFPRGFLWDEGFHQLLVHHWDHALSEDVLLHWLALMEPNGWIPREQILGPEARTRVPDEFVPQHPEHTNPPAMILVLQGMLLDRQQRQRQKHDDGDAGSSSSSIAAEGGDDTFSEKVLPLLGRWFKFVVASQCGGDPARCTAEALRLASQPPEEDLATLNGNRVQLEAANSSFLFRWRSRNGYHLLASGLDDYPRPHCRPDAELHVDLFSWAHMMSRALRELMRSTGADAAGNVRALRDFSQLPQLKVSDDAWRKWLVKLHWSKEFGHFSDSRGCSHLLQAETSAASAAAESAEAKRAKRLAKTDFSPFFGYVNLWPVLTLSLEADDREFILATLRKARAELSGGKGLQSLSNSSRRLLDKHDDYWTGPVWINVNFLFLRALHRKYMGIVGPEAVAIYEEVRRDVLSNVARVFAETGKLWENYDWKTGSGRGTAPFTGWTTLVILIAAEKY